MISYITTYQSMVGWKSVQMHLNQENNEVEVLVGPDKGTKKKVPDYWEPWETGSFVYQTEQGAISDAQLWAATAELPYVPRGEDPAPYLEKFNKEHLSKEEQYQRYLDAAEELED